MYEDNAPAAMMTITLLASFSGAWWAWQAGWHVAAYASAAVCALLVIATMWHEG